jgi:hypothetical protein
MDRNELLLDTHHQGVPSGVPKMISMSVVHLAQTMHLSSAEINTISKQTEQAFTWPTTPRSTIGCVQNDFHAVVHSTQTLHLSCAKSNTISKWTETSFHLTHITKEYHRVRPKWFPTLWYVVRIPCTYLVPRLTLSPNRPKQPSTLHTLPRSTNGCAQSDFHSRGTFVANSAPILHRIKTISKWIEMSFRLTHVTKEYHWVHLKWFLCLWYVWRKPCTYLAPRLIIYLNRPKQASTWHTLHRSTNGCAQSHFNACGTLDVNHAPFLHPN